MPFSCILARDKCGGIGCNGSLPWIIKEDMAEFYRITTSNYEKIKPLSGQAFEKSFNNGSSNIETFEKSKHLSGQSSKINNIVIMGKRTWNSLKKPLKNRINIIVSTSLSITRDNRDNRDTTRDNRDAPLNIIPNLDVHFVSSFDSALELCKIYGEGKNIFVIGGKRLYKEAFNHDKLESIYLTNISFNEEMKYDVYFEDPIPLNFILEYSRDVITENYTLQFCKYNKHVMTSELNYINLLKQVLSQGDEREDRTNTGTISLFGSQIEFDLVSFPLLTTKKVPLRIVFEELMWFLRGQTNNNILQQKKVYIWNGNSSPEYMKSRGLDHYPSGELGPIYGAQWRNFGGKHTFNVENHISNSPDDGVDQISDVINLLKTDPYSRRIVVSAWNPKALKEMALPPCHILYQFYVRKIKKSCNNGSSNIETFKKDETLSGQAFEKSCNNGSSNIESFENYLDCKLTIRSNDLFLGAPFNIASYALLTYMISAMCNFIPGRLIYSIGDAHIYKNHIEQIKEQIQRPIRNFPTLSFNKVPEKIEDFQYEYLEVTNYNPHPVIKGDMAI